MILPPDLTDEMVEELSEEDLAEFLVAGGVYDAAAARHVAAVLKGRVQDPPPS